MHIGATTLAKRVTEFAGTSASAYTFDDFEVRIGLGLGLGSRSGLGCHSLRKGCLALLRAFEDCDVHPVNRAANSAQ